MRTLGVDLAAASVGTAAVVIRWSEADGVVEETCQPATDDQIVALRERSDAVGIDAPFGWPDDFVDAVSKHSAGEPWPAASGSQALRMRATDVHLGTTLRMWPLSVSTDRIGIVAFRAAGLLARLDSPRRDGSDHVFEVYPAGALKRWDLDFRLYKRSAEEHRLVRVRILDGLAARFALDFGHHRASIEASADLLDAAIASVIVREAMEGRCDPVPEVLRERALREGWIHLPVAGDPRGRR